jgi:tetratricopeptide (TPR) repeat protein
MSHWAIWLCIVFLIGSSVAADVPFVFDAKTSDVSSYTSTQLEQAHISSPDLVGVPTVIQPEDNETLEFPVTGGGSTPEGTTEKRMGELKRMLNSKVEPDNHRVHKEAVGLALKYPGDHTIDQICSIYGYLKSGDGSKQGWGYVPDPRGLDYFSYANESLVTGDGTNYVGGGDCDDFAILMASLVESIGGTTRIVLAHNNSTGGHAYTEVYLGQLNATNNQVGEILKWLEQTYNTDKIYTHIDTDTKDVWLNLDWSADHPGGPLYQGDKHYVLCIRDTFGKTPLKVPEKNNKPPKIISLISDRSSPQEIGTNVTWTAKAKDPDNDPVLYRFFLNDDPVTKWAKENHWIWTPTENDVDENKIEVQVRDGMHTGQDRYDSNNVTKFTITALKPIPQEQTNQPPIITRLVSDRLGPQNVGTIVTWTVEAEDPDNEQILYRIILNGKPQGVWTGHNSWSWEITNADIGDNQIEAWVRDGKHGDQESFDDRKSVSFAATASEQVATGGKSDTDNPSKWTENGNALFKGGSYEDALKCYEKAIQLSPSYADAWYGKANALGIQGKYEESIACLDKVLKIDPSNLAALNNKGAALFELRRYEEALACYDESIKKDPVYSVPWANKAEVLIKLGKNSEALDCAQKSLDIDSSDAFAWNIKGKALTALGKYTEALDCFVRSIELDPQDAEVWNNKGIVLEKLGQSSEANNAYDKAKELGYIA